MATKGFKGQGAYSTDRGDADCFKRDTYAAARKILRETHDRHGAFFAPISYPTRTFH